MADACIWRKVYQNNANGSRFSGSLNELVQAIKAGADVQLRYYRSSGLREYDFVEWHRRCLSVSIADAADGGTPIVSCAVTDIPDTDLAPSTGRTFSAPFAFEWQVFNTSGARHSAKFNRKTLDVAGDVTDNLGVAWYVRGYEAPWWRGVFATFAELRLRRAGG